MNKKSAWLTVLTLSIAAGPACGGDSHPVADGGASGGGAAMDGGAGTAGSGGRSAGTGGRSSTPAMMGVACGSTTCQPANSMFAGFIDACCVDPAKGLCGMSAMGAACSVPAASDSRCPGVDFMGAFMLASCCTSDGQCGIDASSFGMGCLSLADAAGAAGAMGGGTAGLFPAPRACDSGGVDGGSSDGGT